MDGVASDHEEDENNRDSIWGDFLDSSSEEGGSYDETEEVSR